MKSLAAITSVLLIALISCTATQLTQDQAIALTQSQYPELSSYPCDANKCNSLDDLPREIIAEKQGEIWYLAFIQTGSGLPIVTASCYKVNGETVERIGEYQPNTGATVQEFSPVSCS